MDKEYINEVIGDLQAEVMVKGAATVAANLGVGEETIRELCPREARMHDDAQET